MRRLRARIAQASLLCLLAAMTAPADEPGAAASIEKFTTAASLEGWRFSNGREWPGAKGTLSWAPRGGRDNDGALALGFDFTGGGNYVAAIVDLPEGNAIKAVRFWMHKLSANQLTFRVVDSTGEAFQKHLQYDLPDWQQMDISLDGWIHHWGGDGVYEPPARQFHILVENQGGQKSGTVLVDDLEFLTAASPADTRGVRTNTYQESAFGPSEGWTSSGPEGTGLQMGQWHYRFDEPQRVNGLHWGKSILGRPVKMLLTVESDGSGHELHATCGSHFQQFHTLIGKLDKAGMQAFEVPMGDMKTWRHEGGPNDGMVRYPLRLSAIGLKKAGEGDGGRIAMKKLAFVTEYDAARTVAVIPSVERSADGSVRYNARLRNLHKEPVVGTLRGEVTDLEKTIIAEKLPARIAADGGEVTVGLTVPPTSAAALEGRFQFEAADFVTEPVTLTLARANTETIESKLRPESRMGVGAYLYRFNGVPDAKAWMERMCLLAAAAGVKWTREEFHWNNIERKQGQFDWAFYDQLVETAQAHGISIYGLVCYWTEWTGEPRDESFIEPYCAFLRALVGRYKDRIKHWEIWNEPNIFFWPGPKELYPKLLAAAYKTIKEVDPEAQVLGCSTAGIDLDFIKLVLQHDAPFDALTIHPYRHELDVRGFIQELDNVQKLVGGREVWITEMGWSSELGGRSEREQAGYVARTYLAALASKAVRSVSWYDFREDGEDPFYNEYHFGLVRHDLTPKIGYAALAAVGRIVGDAEPLGEVMLAAATPGEVSPADGLLAYAFRRGDERIVALWPTDRTRLIVLEVGEGRPVVRNVIGEPASVGRAGGMLFVRAERNLPVYLVGGAELEGLTVRPSPVDVAVAQAGYHPGDTIRFNVRGDASASKLAIAEVPLGWEKSQDGALPAGLPVPTTAAPGRYTIQYTLTALDGTTFALPLEVQVVPTLLRG